MSHARDVLREMKRSLAALGGPHEIFVLARDVHGREFRVDLVKMRGGPDRAIILVERED